MTPEQQLINDISNTYQEWIEMCREEDIPALMLGIMSKMLIKERELNKYYKLRLEHVGTSAAKR